MVNAMSEHCCISHILLFQSSTMTNYHCSLLSNTLGSQIVEWECIHIVKYRFYLSTNCTVHLNLFLSISNCRWCVSGQTELARVNNICIQIGKSTMDYDLLCMYTTTTSYGGVIPFWIPEYILMQFWTVFFFV